MATNNLFKSDLYKIYNIVQNSMIVYPKEIIIAFLRDYFSKDTYYHYSRDPWGFPNTPDHTDLPLGSGLNNDITTRVFIGENYREDVIYYPAIFVKNNGSKYVPISLNREKGAVQWKFTEFDDGYGNKAFYKSPKSFLTQGAWEGTINVDIRTRSLRSRDDLVELVSIYLTDIAFEALQKAGLVIKSVSAGSPSETDDRNDKLFMQTITLEVRSEWRIEIPVGNLVEIINFSIDFADIEHNHPPASNLTIQTNALLIDNLLNELYKVIPNP